MINKPLVSVILPTYNRAHTLRRAINSVLNQTYKNFELIIIDDASTDNTEELIKKIKQIDGRIKYVKCKKNIGAALARNKGLDLAQGDYIAFQDSDDEWLPQKLEKQIKKFEQNPEADIVYHSLSIHHKKTGKKLKMIRAKYAGTNLFPMLLKKMIILPTISVMCKKTCIDQVGGFDDSPSHQDYLLYLKLARAGFYFQPLDVQLAKIYLEKQSVSRTNENWIKGRENVIKFIQNSEVSEQLKKDAVAHHSFHLAKHYLVADQQNRAKQYFRKGIAASDTLIKFKSTAFFIGTSLLPNFKNVYLKLGKLVLNNHFFNNN
jgi:glycosyltransferase involved in cell wall biosynthesis